MEGQKVTVARILIDSIIDRQGLLQTGDVILQANGKNVKDAEQLQKAIEEAKKNALRECEWDADGLLNKAIEVGTLFLIDFPCKVLFTENLKFVITDGTLKMFSLIVQWQKNLKKIHERYAIRPYVVKNCNHK